MALNRFLSPPRSPWFSYRHKATNALMPILKPGDILIRRGNHLVLGLPFSKLVEWVTDAKYSHAALVLDTSNNDVLIVEASDNGVRRIFLIDWIDEVIGTDFMVLRYKGIQPLGVYDVIKKAKELIAKDLPYNTTYDNSRTDALYCVQFIYECYQYANIPLAKGLTLRQMPNWKPWLRLLALFLGFQLNNVMYFVGNKRVGLMSSDSLYPLVRAKIEAKSFCTDMVGLADQ